MSLKEISKIDIKELETLIRPSGFYKQKAKRLKALAIYIIKTHGSLSNLFKSDVSTLRKKLLSLNGIGKETADSIILYASQKRIFVIDAYTRRIFNRIYNTDKDIEYDNLQKIITDSIKPETILYKDFHAQFVELGKNYCKTKPLCVECPVNMYCNYYQKSE